MFDIQAQEELDHQMGSASELQNAFSISQMTYDYSHVDRAEIDRLVAAGKFPVVRSSMAQCPYTDAILPRTNDHLDHVADSREAAQAFIAERAEDYYDDHFTIYPKIAQPVIEITEGDIPF